MKKIEDELERLEKENRLLKSNLVKMKLPVSEPVSEESGEKMFFPFGTVPKVRVKRDE